MMKRPSVNFLIDCLSFVLLAGLVFTGIILKWILPPGMGGYRGGRGGEAPDFFALTRHEWGDVHFWISIGFFVLMVVHLIIHYKWIKAYVKSRWFNKT